MDVNLLGTVAEDKGGETFAEREARSFRQLGRMERLRKEGQLGEGLGGEAPQSDEEEDEEDEVVEGRADKGKKKMRYVYLLKRLLLATAR
jgi:U3 small nucleolar RNA-associated protein 7